MTRLNLNLAKTIKAIKQRPQLSTLMSAAFLAAVWTAAWLIVFFGSLFFLSESSTSLYGLFIGMWLSTCVEALIRYVENTKLAAQFGKPHEKKAKGDNLDYGFGRAFILFTVGAVIVLILGFTIAQDWVLIPKDSFNGVPKGANIHEIVLEWWLILQSPLTISIIMACFLLRVAIYKRVAYPTDRFHKEQR